MSTRLRCWGHPDRRKVKRKGFQITVELVVIRDCTGGKADDIGETWFGPSSRLGSGGTGGMAEFGVAGVTPDAETFPMNQD